MAKFSFDPARCTRCHACEVACAMWHDIPAGFRAYRVVEEVETGAFPQVERMFTSRALPGCDLCAAAGGTPRCALTCPTGALSLEQASLELVPYDNASCGLDHSSWKRVPVCAEQRTGRTS